MERYLANEADESQKKQLFEFLAAASEDNELKDYMLQIWENSVADSEPAPVDWDKMFKTVLQEHQTHPARVRKISWYRVAAAVIVVTLLSLAGFYLYPPTGGQGPTAMSEKPADASTFGLPPTSNKAKLTLADGTILSIDSSLSGLISTQGDVSVNRMADGSISYVGSDEQVMINTLTVPRGSLPTQLILSDGTTVWLNVESSISYPTSFVGNSRNVTVSGEAYFEVAPNRDMPFVVTRNDVAVKVLGTHFNVDGYENDANMAVTLLEGSVMVYERNSSALLKPGQQAIIANQGERKISVRKAETDKVMAWRSGLFDFDGEALPEVMKQLARWYDIDVVYESGIPNIEFMGKMSKNLKLNEVLEILEKTKVKFRLTDGNRLIVSK